MPVVVHKKACNVLVCKNNVLFPIKFNIISMLVRFSVKSESQKSESASVT